MSTTENGFKPDYAVHPGMLLEQELEHGGLSQAEFARRIARSAKLVSEIISGKNPIEPETALQFERVLGIGADVWLGLEARYRLAQARAAEHKSLQSAAVWLSKFPLRELTAWGIVRKAGDTSEKARDLLAFFGVASPDAFESRYAQITVHYRRSKTMRASTEALLTWLRCGEVKASLEKVPAFDKAKFNSALYRIRSLTTEKIETFRPKMTAICKEAGVVFVLIPPLPRTCLSGAAYWAKGVTPVIQQSLRHKTNDHFWFTFFHEAGHIILHNSKDVYADDERGQGNDVETEANAFATDKLVGTQRLEDFIASGRRGAQDVVAFAKSAGVHPGIVVGMLQHHGVLHWSHLNRLKSTFEWKSD
jgi:HTH-type transcriptional regulator/antitoxin HigA